MEDTSATPPPPAKSVTPKPLKSKASRTPDAGGSETLPTLINPAWAAAIIKKEDIIGKTAELAVVILTSAIEKQVLKATKPEKLEKIVWSAITEARSKARG